ncbi:MAG: hypothetical protein OSJ58_01825 [Dysosmobacter sp.]|nr:hypothetical protein [Dysosmobacter sp.]
MPKVYPVNIFDLEASLGFLGIRQDSKENRFVQQADGCWRRCRLTGISTG